MSLATYSKKRNFKKTPEPTGGREKKTNGLKFVVQRHDASHLHYDFRLQVNGVLKSWAIPKGPSMNPDDKRLAVQVEDHPLAYGNFEGVIPKGNYGAGTVEIWDKGTYEPEEADGDPQKEIAKALKKGSLKINLRGKKLKGSFALVQMHDGKNWLLIKHRDSHAGAKEETTSKPARKRATSKAKTKATEEDVEEDVRSVRSGNDKLTKFIHPMLAKVGDHPFDDEEWLFEVKWDGYRAVAEVSKGDVLLYSRNGLSFKKLYPAVASELSKIKSDVVLDGEIVVLDEKGKPSFQKLQHYSENRRLPIMYYVFDCLKYKGKDLKRLPLVERKAIAKKALPKSDVIRYSDDVENGGQDFFAKVVDMGLEGMIAKRKTSEYLAGKRTTDWLKIKNHNTQEAIIAGYTAPRRSRKYFGALVLGMYKKDKLVYIGHTGTGFTDKILKELHQTLKPLVRDSSPFDEKVPVNSPITWVEPVQVCMVKYTELTNDGILRHPVFMGLRVDKAATEVDSLDKTVKKTPAKSKRKASTKTAAKRVAKKQPAKKEPTSTGGDKLKKAIGGHSVAISNPDKVYFPDEGVTKGEVIEYYNAIHSHILPYLKDRPQSLKRNPNGILDKGFFHKDAGEAAPSWVKHEKLYSESAGKDIDYIICNNAATLAYLNNLGCIEINPWNSRLKKLDNPDYLILDIDPSEKSSFNDVIDTALVIKDILDKAGAPAYCKTSGATGLHVYVPLHARYDYDHARDFAHVVATFAEQQLPDTTTLERSLSKRGGRIYLDYLQNKRGQTLASVYSLRPVAGASVSTPLHWKEVKHGLDPRDFTITTLPKRLAKTGDLFSGVLTEKTDLAKCLAKLES